MADETQRLECKQAEVQPQVSRLAMVAVVASTVFAVVSLLVMTRPRVAGVWAVAGLAAGGMVWQVRGRVRRGREEDARCGAWAKGLLVLGWVVGGLGVVGVTLVRLSHYGIDRTMCSSSMKQIGSAILLYADDNQGRFPDRLQQLLLTQDISAQAFVCAGSDDVASRESTPQAAAQELTIGGHLSYVYIGAGLTNPLDPDTVVLYESLSNHLVGGMNVLFGDGHVDFVRGAAAREIVDRAAAGERPLVWKGPGVRAGPTTMGR